MELVTTCTSTCIKKVYTITMTQFIIFKNILYLYLCLISMKPIKFSIITKYHDHIRRNSLIIYDVLHKYEIIYFELVDNKNNK